MGLVFMHCFMRDGPSLWLPGWPAIVLVALPSHPASGTEEQ